MGDTSVYGDEGREVSSIRKKWHGTADRRAAKKFFSLHRSGRFEKGKNRTDAWGMRKERKGGKKGESNFRERDRSGDPRFAILFPSRFLNMLSWFCNFFCDISHESLARRRGIAL